MKKIIPIFFSVLFLVWNSNAYASILGAEELNIDFTSQADAKEKAEWLQNDKINITKEGLGWDGEESASYDFWIQTIPLAVGLSWRPAQSVNVSVELKPEVRPITLANGQEFSPYIGNMFVRYSPDGKHWSQWQGMEYPTPAVKVSSERKFTTFLNIPQREREVYISYMEKYRKLDVPWVSDEEALVKWILKQDPEFFSNSLPFIGYLQFLYETSLNGGRRITKLHAIASFGLSGLHQAPKDKSLYKERDNIPWRFQSE
jgi:hypothetical protein